MVKIILKNAELLRLLIAESGRTQKDFALKNGFSASYLTSILNGKKNPSPRIAHQIAKGLGLHIEDLFILSVNPVSEKIKNIH